MSEHNQSKGYMQELNSWTNAEVIVPLMHAIRSGNEEVFSEAARQVERAIREKVLESYHNGQAAAPARSFKRPAYAKR